MQPHPIPAVSITSDALSAERTRLDVIAANIANAQTTRGPDGQPYHRKEVVFESFMPQEITPGTQNMPHLKVAKIVDDPRPLPQVYMPGHPHADANGMVAMPNVNVTEEMVDLMTATRSFEANLQVVQNARQMFSQALKIGDA